MASPSSSLRYVLFLIHVTVITTGGIFYRPSDAVTLDEINNICHQSMDYQLCFNALAFDGRTPGASIEGLCLISVYKTINQVKETEGKIPGLLSKLTDAVDRRRMRYCDYEYKMADKFFSKAADLAAAKDFRGVFRWVQNGTNYVITCQNFYRQRPPVRECPLNVDNNNVVKLSGVILIILGMLGV